MTYLLAKYTLLFLLATILGFVFGYWWSRRRMVDVTESYEDLRLAAEQEDQANWKRLWQRLDALPADFAPVEHRLDSLAARIDEIPAPPVPERVDLQPVKSDLSDIRERIGAIPGVDLRPVQKDLADIRERIGAIPSVDLKPVHGELSDIRERIGAIPSVDLQPVRSDLTNVRERIGAIPGVDLRPVQKDLADIRERIGAIPSVDLAPIDGRLHKVETELASLGKRLASSPQPRQRAERKTAPAKPKSDGPRLLSAAIYGSKDDLKRISGVGPKLQTLLNENGIYYFWQVASWSRDDVNIIDAQLDVFKGRIARDDWVSQARQLKEAPDAARTPAD